MPPLRNLIAVLPALGVAAAASSLLAWSILSGGAVDTEHAIDPSARPSEEYAAPCTDPDGVCLAYDDIRGSEIQRPTAAQLMAEHDCWTMLDGAPADVDIPGAAVISVDGGDPEYTTNALAVGAALDAALDGAENGVEAIAFCRGDE